jgi:hypothetical protein
MVAAVWSGQTRPAGRFTHHTVMRWIVFRPPAAVRDDVEVYGGRYTACGKHATHCPACTHLQ